MDTCGNCKNWVRVNVPEQLMGDCPKFGCRKHRDGVCIKEGFEAV